MTATLALHDLVHRFYEQMLERKAFTQLDENSRAMIDKAMEKVIDGTDSRIRLVPNYRRKLYKSILTALDYADRLVTKIPHTIDLDSRHFVDDPYLRALFPTLDGLRRVCHRSSELREFFREPAHWQSEQGTALLCMHRNEETVYGMELEGEHVIRDVRQQRVTFEDHHLYSPAEDEQMARLGLKCCIFEGLVNNALSNLSAMRKRRLALETRQQVLNARMRSQCRLGTTSPDFQRRVRERADLGAEENELKAIEKELAEIGYLTPENCLQQVNATLSEPQKFIRLKKIPYRLDSNNIIRSKNDTSHKSRELHFAEVRIRGEQPRVVTLARINRQDVEAPEPQTAIIH